MANIAIISADLIHSSKLSSEQVSAELEACKQAYSRWREQGARDLDFFRGDSFQCRIEDPQWAMHLAIDIIASVKSISPYSEDGKKRGRSRFSPADIRMGIGLGEAEPNEGESFGSAFVRSGKALDGLGNSDLRIAFRSSSFQFNRAMEMALQLLNPILDRWTVPSAEIVPLLLQGKKDGEIAQIIGIAASSMSQRKSVASWKSIEALLRYFQDSVK